MTIEKNLKKMHAAVTKDLLNDPPTLGAKLNYAAVAALTGGMKSDAWKSYMAIFADNEAQLERLTVPQAGEPFYIKQMRAYMVSNAICDIATNGHTNKTVGPEIDEGLDATPAAGDEVAQFRPEGLKEIP